MPKYRKFPHTKLGTCAKFPDTQHGNLETWISRLGKIAFSGLKKEENFYTLREVPWTVGFTNRQKSKFQTTKTWKICSHEAWYPLMVDFTTRQNRIFETQKLIKFPPSLRGTLKRWFHESAEIAFSGCQNAENLIIRVLATWISRQVKTHFQAS